MRSGFSLLEILITGVVIAAAMTPLLMSLRSSTRSVTGTREMLSAVAFAQGALEELRAAAFRPVRSASLPTGALPSLDDQAAALTGALTENGVTYQRRVRLVPEKARDLGAGFPDLRLVQVDVTWQPAGATLLGDHRYQLVSLIGSGTQP